MFESDFLTGSAASNHAYLHLVGKAVESIAASLPAQPYAGKSPSALEALIDPDFLPQTGCSPDQIVETLRTVVVNSINVSHPHTAAHLHCPPLIASLAAEVVISALNQSMDSFDQAPFATVIEQNIIRWLCSEIRFPVGADGTFTTGGSQSNYMGFLLARDAAIHKRWKCSAQKSGLPPDARRLRILCSEVAHFTVEKSASQLGLGTESVVRVAVDDHFRMDPSALRSSLERLDSNGLVPMAIVATAGTTDFGCIDPLPELASVARSADTWLHVDAAYGGALLFSGQYREKLAGIDAADSLSIDFHKLFWQPIPCSTFLLRDARNLDFIKMYADYLNPETHEDEGLPNLVTTSLLTSRRFDALKLWISFQSLGRTKLAAMIERTIALALHAAEVIRNTPQLELVCAPQLSTVVFRYLPSLGDPDRINSAIRQHFLETGEAIIGHTRVRHRQFLKFTFMNPSATENDAQTLLEKVREAGGQLERDSALR